MHSGAALFSSLIVMAWAAPLAAEADHGDVNRMLAEQVVTPLYETYRTSMRQQVFAIEALCDTPGEETLQEARSAFFAGLNGWQRLQPVVFGPVKEQGLVSRIHFWPDKHGTAGRQLSKLLAKSDPAELENGVAGKSAALQSMTALERVLFEQDDLLLSGEGAFACSLVLAIANYQDSLSSDVQQAWDGDRGQSALFVNAGDGNDAYYDAADATTDLFSAVAANLDGMVANKLERPLGKSLEGAKPKRAEDWRSARSLPNIIANLETIKAIYAEPGGLHVFLSEQGQGGLDETLKKGLDQTLATAKAIPMPLHEAVEDEAARQQVEQLLQQVKSLRVLFTGTLADAASLTVGFNKSDGD